MVQSCSWSLLAGGESFLDHWHRTDLDGALEMAITNPSAQMHTNNCIRTALPGTFCNATLYITTTALNANTTLLNCMPLKLHTANYVELTDLGWLVIVISISAIVAFHRHLPLLHPASFPCEGLALLHAETWTATIQRWSKVPHTDQWLDGRAAIGRSHIPTKGQQGPEL